MGLIYDLSKKYETLSIVGMAKNAGKTTALNYLIEEADDEELQLGITSTGRDGETVDLATGTDKPRVYLYEGTIVSVPTQLFDMAEASLEIVEMTTYGTAIGDLMICRVRESGYVQIAGPVSAAETKRLSADMLRLGCEMILIDGAIDRKSVAEPETSDAVILATGAVLSRNLKSVVDETSHIVNLYNLPEIEDKELADVVKENMIEKKVMIIDKKLNVEILDLSTGLGAGRHIDEAISEDTLCVFIPGAFTESVIADISPAKMKKIEFILKDPTRIFIDVMRWRRYVKKGLRVKVIKNIKIAAVTVNPFSPSGYSFDRNALIEAMRKQIPDIPIIDVRM